MKMVVLCFSLIWLVTSCASLRSVSLTQIPQQREKAVTAQTEKFIFLGFNFDNDYVDQLTTQLRNQCSGGQIKGILTKDEVIDYFLAHRRRITLTGYCVL